jgi:class 3 adenylate cyclase
MSESMTARRTLNFLNSYLGRMQPIIEQRRGIIDKYFGDGILALWPTDPDAAVEAAITMQRELVSFNEKIAADNTWLGREIRIGVGLHTGRLMMGAIGSKNRIDMSVIGDTVNLGESLRTLRFFVSTWLTPILSLTARRPDQVLQGRRDRVGRHASPAQAPAEL